MQKPLKYELEVQEDGRIELEIPLPQGTQVTVFVTQEPVDDYSWRYGDVPDYIPYATALSRP